MVAFIVGVLAVLIGGAFCFMGFRLFLVLMPLWGFLVGFSIGSSAVSALLGEGFLGTVTGWVAGLVIGIALAVISFFWYWAAIIVLCGSLGYSLGAGLFASVGGLGVLSFTLGIACAVIAILVAIRLKVPQYLIICYTAFNGASALIAGLLLWFGAISVGDLVQGAVGGIIRGSWLWLLVYLAVALAGVAVQGATRSGATLERKAYQY